MFIPRSRPGFTHPRFLRPFGGVAKRLADLALAIPAALFAAPLMLVVAWAVKLQDGGPMFYLQSRIGLGGGTFPLIKFRTMATDASERLAQLLRDDPAAAQEWKDKQKLTNDPRITPVGRFLRRSSLDELPQLLNVILGHMSLVGPRPMLVDQPIEYGPVYDAYCGARPGLTGLWQVSGRNNTTFRRRSELDARYLRGWSLTGDLFLMVRTVGVLLNQAGAC
jgi:lipopolysaccharide/colanic/teichoic acid biosynthesis glycosyltransferase